MQFIDASEAIKRLAAAQGIDVLNLVKSPETMDEEAAASEEQALQQSLTDQASQLMSAPVFDPSKNPDAQQMAQQVMNPQTPPPPEV